MAQVSLPGTPRRFVTRWCRTSDDAKIVLEGLLEAHGISEPFDDRQLLGDFLHNWLRAVAPGLRPSTLRHYRGHIDHQIEPLLGTIPIGRLRVSDVERLVAQQVQKGAAPGTITVLLATLSGALAWAVRDGVLARNVASLARHPRVERKLVVAMSPAEAQAILAATADDVHAALYALLLGSGLRLGEALALDWADVDLDVGAVRVKTGKTARARRVVPIGAPTVAALREHRKTSLARGVDIGPTGPVFVGVLTGKRLTQVTPSKAFARMLERASLPHRRLHDLRHGHATLLLATGTDMRVIADQLGHAKPSMTANVYAHVVSGRQREAVDRLAEVL